MDKSNKFDQVSHNPSQEPINMAFSQMATIKCAIKNSGIELTDEQIDKLINKKVAVKETMLPNVLKLKRLKIQALDLVFGDEVAEAELKQIQKASVDLANDLMFAFSDGIIEMAKVFTPDQRRKIRTSVKRAQLSLS